jgi:urease accessory protein
MMSEAPAGLNHTVADNSFSDGCRNAGFGFNSSRARGKNVNEEVLVPFPLLKSLPRSTGVIDLQFLLKDGMSCAERTFQSGAMRVRFPNVARNSAPEAVLVNTAGGMTGGDCLSVDVDMGEGTRAIVSTLAHEKIYRSGEGHASIGGSVRLGDEAVLEWLLQPTILFDGARLVRETNVEMVGSATFLGVEAVIFGRHAMGEVMKTGYLSDSWTIRRDGRLIHVDRFIAEDDFEALLGKSTVLAGDMAMATIRYVAPDAANRLDDIRAALDGDGGASFWNGMLVSRVVANDGYQLGKALIRILGAVRRRPLPSVWSI